MRLAHVRRANSAYWSASFMVSSMTDLSDEEFAAALERGRLYRATQPHATAARYDAASDQVVVELESGATFTFSPKVVEGLTEATAEQLSDIELLGDGFGLHGERLDVDYTVAGLVNGIFGTARWMARCLQKPNG